MIGIWFQVVALAAAVVALVLWAMYFPYPSPLIRIFLPPRARWPAGQVYRWLARGKVNRSYLRYFSRDPERNIPSGTSILAPADGKVTSIEIRDEILYLVIALSFWDVHVQRSPIAGVVESIECAGSEFMDGEGRDMAFLREKRAPVQKRMVIANDTVTLGVRLVTSFAARRIETWAQPGECVDRGQRIGRILLGSTVVLELPREANILIPCGASVTAGETPVAECPA